MAKQLPETRRRVLLRGVRAAMFDRYAGDNKTQLRPDQKLYLGQDGKTIVLPALNLVSLLSAQNTPSAAKRFLDSRQYKKVAQAIQSYTAIDPMEIPFLRDGKPIIFGGLDENNVDKQSGVYVESHVARLHNGIPNPKIRPVLPLPWSLEFELTIFRNDEVQEDLIQNLFTKAGMAIGIGTFRGVYGKFLVEEWS